MTCTLNEQDLRRRKEENGGRMGGVTEVLLSVCEKAVMERLRDEVDM